MPASTTASSPTTTASRSAGARPARATGSRSSSPSSASTPTRPSGRSRCFLVAPSHRRLGVARALLRDALTDLRARGITRVEAYPREGAGLGEEDIWTGPARLFVAEGFTHVGDSPRGPVLALDL